MKMAAHGAKTPMRARSWASFRASSKQPRHMRAAKQRGLFSFGGHEMEKVEAGKELSMMEKDVQTRSKRACAICGKPLPPGRPRYCSEACEKAYTQQREKSRTGKKPRLPPFRMLTCPICGTVEQRHIKSNLCSACQDEKNKKNITNYSMHYS